MNLNDWNIISPEHPKPPNGAKCRLLIEGEGSYVATLNGESQLEFDLKPTGIKKIIAWQELGQND